MSMYLQCILASLPGIASTNERIDRLRPVVGPVGHFTSSCLDAQSQSHVGRSHGPSPFSEHHVDSFSCTCSSQHPGSKCATWTVVSPMARETAGIDEHGGGVNGVQVCHQAIGCLITEKMRDRPVQKGGQGGQHRTVDHGHSTRCRCWAAAARSSALALRV